MPKTTTRKPARGSAGIDLAKLFGTVVTNLADNREVLNQADAYNHDHGDNMVQIFQTVANVIGKSKGVDQASQLRSASDALRKSKSGSAQVYAENLSRASQQFQGQTITPDKGGQLLQALLGSTGAATPSRQAPSAGEDLLGSLLGGMGGQSTQGQATSAGGDLLGSLLGGLGGQPAQGSTGSDGLDLGDLLNAGMAYMNAKQQGSGNVEALVSAVVSASPLGQSSHRAQSGAVVANTIMQVLGGLAKK